MESAQGRIKTSSARRTIVRSVLALGLALACVSAVKREDFKTCSQSGFCTRNRAYADIAKESPQWTSPFQLNPSSLRLHKGILTGDLINVQEEQQPSDKPALAFELHLLDTDVARVRINERNPIHPRYDGVQETVLVKPIGHAAEETYKRLDKDVDGILTIQYGAQSQNTVRISSSPFKIEFLVNGVPTVLLNDEGLLRFERLRNKEEPKVEEEKKETDEAEADPLVEQKTSGNDIEIAIEKSESEKKLDENLWEERFKDFTDSKPRGNAYT